MHSDAAFCQITLTSFMDLLPSFTFKVIWVLVSFDVVMGSNAAAPFLIIMVTGVVLILPSFMYLDILCVISAADISLHVSSQVVFLQNGPELCNWVLLSHTRGPRQTPTRNTKGSFLVLVSQGYFLCYVCVSFLINLMCGIFLRFLDTMSVYKCYYCFHVNCSMFVMMIGFLLRLVQPV